MKSVWMTPATMAYGILGFTDSSRSVPARNRRIDSQKWYTLWRSGSVTDSADTLNKGAPFTTTGMPMLLVRGRTV